MTAAGTCCPRCALEREWLRLRHSPLLGAGGMALFEGLIDARLQAALLHEAMNNTPRLDDFPAGRDAEQVRGGCPPRRLRSVTGGVQLASLYRDARIAAFVANQVRTPVRRCGEQATFSIYAGAGAHLGLHRDVPGCDLALIACLYDNAAHGDGGATEAWPEDLLTPLGELRGGTAEAEVRVCLQPGQAMLMHGGLLPHRIRPTEAGRLRIVALMCFQAVT